MAILTGQPVLAATPHKNWGVVLLPHALAKGSDNTGTDAVGIGRSTALLSDVTYFDKTAVQLRHYISGSRLSRVRNSGHPVTPHVTATGTVELPSDFCSSFILQQVTADRFGGAHKAVGYCVFA